MNLWGALVGDGYVAIIVRLSLGIACGLAVKQGLLTAEQAQGLQDAIIVSLPWSLTAGMTGLVAFITSAINKKIDTENKIVRPTSEGGRKFASFAPVLPDRPPRK